MLSRYFILQKPHPKVIFTCLFCFYHSSMIIFFNEAIINMTLQEGSEDSLHEQRKPWPAWFKCFLSEFCCECLGAFSVGLVKGKCVGSVQKSHPSLRLDQVRQMGQCWEHWQQVERANDGLKSQAQRVRLQMFTKTWIWKIIYW